MSEKFNSIIIPMIRKVVPAMIAQDLVGVQPMTGVWKIKWDFTEKDGRWGAYYSPMGLEVPELLKWCRDTFGEPGPDKKWDLESGHLSFEKRMYVDWFLLRWSR